jgi:hypothetical protein
MRNIVDGLSSGCSLVTPQDKGQVESPRIGQRGLFAIIGEGPADRRYPGGDFHGWYVAHTTRKAQKINESECDPTTGTLPQ